MSSFTDNYKRSYTTSAFSFPHLMCLFVYYLTVAIPFYFCFTGENFWFDQKTNLMYVELSNSGLYALQVVDTNDLSTVSCNIPGISNTLNTLQANVDIIDRANYTQITINLNNFATKIISSVNFVTFYNASVPLLDRRISTALQFGFSGNVQGAQSNGMIWFQQSDPVQGLKQSTQVNTPIEYPNFSPPSSFSDISDNIKNSKYGIEKDVYTSIQRSQTNLGTRTLTMRLNKKLVIPMTYYPSLLETLKFKFSRFLAFFLIAYLFFRWFLLLNLKHDTIQAMVKDQVPKRWV